MHLLLLHFNSLFGPEVFFSLPDDVPGSLSHKIQKIFDLEVLDKFFEITIKMDEVIYIYCNYGGVLDYRR